METLNDLHLSGLPKIFFGAGAVLRLPEIARSYGRQALVLIGGQSLAASGRWQALAAGLAGAGLSYRVFSIRSEPTAALIDGITAELGRTPVDVVAAVGGGSVIDCGKAVSAMLAQEGSVKDYLEGVGTQKPSGAKVPFIAVPTTAGTGSEATTNAVVCDRSAGYKKSLRHDAYLPDVALVDPELTLGTPEPVTLACGLDAVAQLVESFTSTKAEAALDAPALKALCFAAESLPPLALGQSDTVALRGKMSYAALVSGIMLSRAGLGAVHGLAGPLGGLCPVPHGLACGRLLFPVMTFVVKKVIDENNGPAIRRFAAIGNAFAGLGGGDDLSGCRRFLEALGRWTRSFRLPPLSQFGMTAEVMAKAVLLADNKNSPARLSPAEMKVVLETVR